MSETRYTHDRMKILPRKHLSSEQRARWFWDKIQSGRFSDPATVAALANEHGAWFAKFEEAKA